MHFLIIDAISGVIYDHALICGDIKILPCTNVKVDLNIRLLFYKYIV